MRYYSCSLAVIFKRTLTVADAVPEQKANKILVRPNFVGLPISVFLRLNARSFGLVRLDQKPGNLEQQIVLKSLWSECTAVASVA